jgi:hypothetical protein
MWNFRLCFESVLFFNELYEQNLAFSLFLVYLGLSSPGPRDYRSSRFYIAAATYENFLRRILHYTNAGLVVALATNTSPGHLLPIPDVICT